MTKVMLGYLDKHIETTLLEKNAERAKNHKSSGKLSAGRLGWPVQWQVLKAIGVPSSPLQEYTVRKFLRGNHVEDWLRTMIPGLVEEERFVEYRDVVGYVDAVVNMDDWNLPHIKGEVPHEIKSTANSAFKWVIRDGAKKGHQLQAALYALAMGSEYFVIDYVASDDYRVKEFVGKTSDFADEVHDIIENYDEARALKIVPEFEPKEKWQANVKYNNYVEFADLNEKEILNLLETKYPQQYKKLKA